MSKYVGLYSNVVNFVHSKRRLPHSSNRDVPKSEGSMHKEPPNCTYGMGNYCMKATVKRMDSNGDLKNYYHGYSHDLDISNLTFEACERYRGDDETCQPPTLMVIRDMPCRARVIETDAYNKTIRAVPVSPFSSGF